MLVTFLACVALAWSPQAAASAQSRQSSAGGSSLARVDRAIFRIETGSGTGSGFQYRTPGYVLTNKHVVEDVPVGSSVSLRAVKIAADGSVGLGEPFSGNVRHKHPELDIAVIEVPTKVSATALNALATKDGKHVPRGTEVYAHGFPGVGAPTLSRGMLSAHYPDPLTGQVFYLTDTALSPGSSGGPVTDATGSVVGVATAVSIVVDGAGNSWGYVLPIKSVEDALQCQKGFAGLPAPFDLAKHLRALKDCKSPELAMDRYRVAAEEAAKRCATASDLADAAAKLAEATAACPGRLARDRFGEWNDDSLRAGEALLTRAFEFMITDRDESSRIALKSLFEGKALLAWGQAVVERTIEFASEDERPVVVAELLSAHAAGVSALIKASGGCCGAMKQAAEALNTSGATNRRDVKAFAKALASLAQTRTNLATIDPDQLDPDDSGLPVKARQQIRMSKAILENCVDEWMALPEACREEAERVLEVVNTGEGEVGDAEAAVAPRDGGIALERWEAAGFTVWGESLKGSSSDGEKSFWLDFGESPSMVWVVMRSSRDASYSATATLDKGKGELPLCGRVSADGAEWWAFEVPSDGKLSFEIASGDGKDFDYELTVIHRSCGLGAFRSAVAGSKEEPGMEEFACKSFVLSPGKYDEFILDASDMKAFSVMAVDPMKGDIDLVVLDSAGNEVGRDDKPDSVPVVTVSPVRPGKYRLRFSNAGKNFAVVDSIVFSR